MTFLLLSLLACGAPEPTRAVDEAPTAAADHGDHAGHVAADHADHADHAAMGHADAHAGHSDHMADMARTREGLRAALGAAYDQPVPGLDQADHAAGATVYEASCASCHGSTGKGDGPAAKGLNPPAADFTDAFHARYYSDAARVRIIEEGLPGTAMAGFAGTLTPQQILDVYAHVRMFRGEPSAAPGGHDHHAGH